MSKKTTLSLNQFIFLIYKMQIGVGVLTLPHDLFLSNGTDGWVVILFGWLITVIISFLMINTLEKHPNETMYDLLPKYFGKWIGKAILLCWILYTLYAASYVFTYAVFIIKVWVLPNTHPFFIGLLFIIPIFQVAFRGLSLISHYADFTFLITLWMYPVILITAHYGLWLNLLPVIKDGWMPIFKSTPTTALSFLGFELVYLLYPLLKNKKHAYKGMFIANTMTAIVLLMVTILSYVRLSEAELMHTVWPTLELIKLVRFPFLERLEIIFISAYVLILFMTIIPYLHMSITGVAQLFQRPSLKNLALIGTFIIWFVIMFSPFIGFQSIIFFNKWFNRLGIIFGFTFPLIFWLYSKVFLALRKGQAKG